MKDNYLHITLSVNSLTPTGGGNFRFLNPDSLFYKIQTKATNKAITIAKAILESDLFSRKVAKKRKDSFYDATSQPFTNKAIAITKAILESNLFFSQRHKETQSHSLRQRQCLCQRLCQRLIPYIIFNNVNIMTK